MSVEVAALDIDGLVGAEAPHVHPRTHSQDRLIANQRQCVVVDLGAVLERQDARPGHRSADPRHHEQAHEGRADDAPAGWDPPSERSPAPKDHQQSHPDQSRDQRQRAAARLGAMGCQGHQPDACQQKSGADEPQGASAAARRFAEQGRQGPAGQRQGHVDQPREVIRVDQRADREMSLDLRIASDRRHGPT